MIARAVRAHADGKLDDAKRLYFSALEIAPGHAGILHNLGVIHAAEGATDEAVRFFTKAIEAQPRSPATYFNRAVALRSLSRFPAAIADYGRVISLEPEHYDAHRALGFLWLQNHRPDRAMDHFARTYDLRRGEDRNGSADYSLSHATRWKLSHDAEQFRYLAKNLRNGEMFGRRAAVYETVGRDFPETAQRLDNEQRDLLGPDYNSPIHCRDTPEILSGALNPQLNVAEIREDFDKSLPGNVAWFDNLLSPAALTALRRHLLESTIWHDFSHIEGFVASYLEDGFACPLVLQIANEVRQVFCGLLGDKALVQAWAFKGVSGDVPIAYHADDAKISLNFWVTPDEANLDPARGGLGICRALPPERWQMTSYDADKIEIANFLAENRDATTVVPYMCNRAVLFNSRLFHGSDAPRFRQGYENHRINVTLLYG